MTNEEIAGRLVALEAFAFSCAGGLLATWAPTIEQAVRWLSGIKRDADAIAFRERLTPAEKARRWP